MILLYFVNFSFYIHIYMWTGGCATQKEYHSAKRRPERFKTRRDFEENAKSKVGKIWKYVQVHLSD